jgi:SAM-dependent methyltransferase
MIDAGQQITAGSAEDIDFRELVPSSASENIKRVDYFSQSLYSNLDVPQTLEFYTNRYVRQLYDFAPVSNSTTIVDVGAGFGWLCMAFALTTEARVIAVDIDAPRLKAAENIARILGVGHRIDWRIGGLGDLPLADREADVVYCIEVLEHVRRSSRAVRSLCDAAADLVVLTTPNLWFPVIAHDTQLPLCHWLPFPLRRVYARLFNRQDHENDNLFWSPYSLRKAMPDFEPVSDWLHFSSYQKFLKTFPYYLPYGRGSYVNRMGPAKSAYYGVVSRLGKLSHWVVPSLAYVFKRVPR